MKNQALPVLLGLLVLGGLTWGLLGTGGDPVIDPTDPKTGGSKTGGDDSPIGELDPERRRNDPADPEGRNDPDDNIRRPRAPSRVTVRGQCVDVTTELPLAGCEIRVTATRNRAAPPVGQGAGATAVDEPATDGLAHTDLEGRFEIDIELPDRYLVRLSTRMIGRADMLGFLSKKRGTAIIDAGTIALPLGSLLRGRVVDANGATQSAVRMRFHQTTAGRRPPPIAPRNWIDAESDAAGILEPDVFMTSGAWLVTVRDSVKLIQPSGGFGIRGDEGVKQQTFVVEPPDPNAMISGRIVDPEGKPVARVSVNAHDDSKWPIGYGLADAKGEFQVRCRAKPGNPVRLAVPRAIGYEPLSTTKRYSWGSRNVVLVLEPAGDITVKVVAAGTDEPIEDFQAVWRRIDQGGGYRGSRDSMRHHPDGEATLDKVPQGTIRIIIIPKDKAYAPNDAVELVKQKGPAKVRIELAKRVELPVRVVRQDGKPIAGTRLEFVRSQDGKPVTLSKYAVDHTLAFQTGAYVLLLDSAVTTAEGTATLRWTPTSEPLAIRVLGPGHVPMVQQPVVIGSANRRLDIVVAGGATIRGTVRPLSVLARLTGRKTEDPDGPGGDPALRRRSSPQAPTVWLTYQGTGGPEGSHRRVTMKVDEQGQFETTGLHPGTWDVAFRVWRPGAGGGAAMNFKEFEPVTVTSGEEHRLELDIRDLQPSMLRGEVIVNGVPQRRGQIHLIRMTKKPDGTFAQAASTILTTDDNGTFVADDIQPGHYRVSAEAKGTDLRRPMRLACPQTVDVPPGNEITHVFQISSGELQIDLKDSKGAPVPRQHIVVSNAENGFRTGAQTDQKGRMVLHPIAAGSYSVGVYAPVEVIREGKRLRAPDKNELSILGRVQVTAGAAPSHFEFTMPAAK